MRDEGFRARFRACWYGDKRGLSLARLKRALGLMDDTLRRDLADMVMTDRPQLLEQVLAQPPEARDCARLESFQPEL